MNRFKKISLASLFILLSIATIVDMVGLVTASSLSGYKPADPLIPFFLGSLTAAVILIIGAYKLSGYILGSENKKDRFVLFFFLSVIFTSIIIWFVTAIFFQSGTL